MKLRFKIKHASLRVAVGLSNTTCGVKSVKYACKAVKKQQLACSSPFAAAPFISCALVLRLLSATCSERQLPFRHRVQKISAEKVALFLVVFVSVEAPLLLVLKVSGSLRSERTETVRNPRVFSLLCAESAGVQLTFDTCHRIEVNY